MLHACTTEFRPWSEAGETLEAIKQPALKDRARTTPDNRIAVVIFAIFDMGLTSPDAF
jgi:hypothetical protein